MQLRRDLSSRAPLRPEFLVLGGIASVQFGAALASSLFDRAGPGGVVFLRLVIGAAILTAAARPRWRGRSRADKLAVLAYGLVLGTMNWSFYEALARLPLGVAVTIEFVGPLAVALAGSRRALDLLWVALAGGGVGLLALHGDPGVIQPSGVLLALAAGACWACYILTSKRVGRSFAQLDGLAIALCIGTVVVIPVGIVQGGSALGQPAVLIGGAGVAVLSSLLPYSLELIALRRLRAAVFGLLMSLEPAVGVLAGVTVLGQSLTAVTGAAIAMVIAASLGTTLSGSRGTVEQLEGEAAIGQ